MLEFGVAHYPHDKGIEARGLCILRDRGGKRARAGNDPNPARSVLAAALSICGLRQGGAHYDWLLGTQKRRSAFARMKATIR